MALEGLIGVVNKMAEEALKMSCGTKPEWGRWSVYPGRETEETIEANLMFAVRPQNIRLPKQSQY